MNDKGDLKQLLAQGKTHSVIQSLLATLAKGQHPDFQQEVILLSSQYEKLVKEKRIGVVPKEDYDVAMAQINYSLLSIIEQLPEKKTSILWQGIRSWPVFMGVISFLMLFLWVYNNAILSTKDTNLQIKIRLEDRKGIPLKEGQVSVDLGHRRNVKSLTSKGEVDFEEIDKKILNTTFKLKLFSNTHQLAFPDSPYVFDGKPTYVLVKKMCNSCKIFGTVQDTSGTLITNAIVMIKGFQLRDTTNSEGYFEIKVPIHVMQEEYPVSVLLSNRIVWENYITPSPNIPTEILLMN